MIEVGSVVNRGELEVLKESKALLEFLRLCKV